MSKKKWKLIFKGNADDFDPSVSLEYWKDRPAKEKFKEVKSLINQALAIKGKKYADASRLLRTTAVLKRS